MKKNFVFLILFVSFLILTTPVLAQISLPNPLGNTNDFPTLINNIARYIFNLVGTLAVLMFIWAGIIYLTSGTNPGNVQKANKVLIYAVIGLAIALAGTGLIQLICSIIGTTCP